MYDGLFRTVTMVTILPFIYVQRLLILSILFLVVSNNKYSYFSTNQKENVIMNKIMIAGFISVDVLD